MIYYFAYGSNLHPQRLVERVASARLVGVSELRHFKLVFHKLGIDGSGKCSLVKSELDGHIVYGAVYRLDSTHKATLDRFESLGKGYEELEISVEHEGEVIRCFTYIAQAPYTDESLRPFHWYKQLVLAGAEYLRFPEHYKMAIASTASIDDPDLLRSEKHQLLLGRMNAYRQQIEGDF